MADTDQPSSDPWIGFNPIPVTTTSPPPINSPAATPDPWAGYSPVNATPPLDVPATEPPSTTWDIIKGLPGAAVRGLASGIAAAGQFGAADADLLNTGSPDEPLESPAIPSAEQGEKIIEQATGPLYHSQTPAGKAVSAGVEAVTANPVMAVMGPSGPVRALGATMASGVGSEEAGELAHAVAPESPGLRTAAELAGGVLSPMAGETAVTGARALRAPPPKPVVNQTMGMTLSAGEAAADNSLRQGESAAYSGQLGDIAQKHAQQFYEQQRPQEQARAKQFIGAHMGAPETVANPGEAADVVANELTSHQNANDLAVRNQGAGVAKRITEYKNRLSPTNSLLAQTPMEAANHVQGAVANEAERAQAATNAAYEALRETPGNFHSATFNNIGSILTQKLRSGSDPTIINPQMTPQANAALSDLDDVLSGLKQTRDPETGRVVSRAPITPQVVENARKRLNTFYGDALQSARSSNNWSDVRATRQVMEAFDNYVADRLRAGTFMNGDPSGVIDAMENARQLHANYRKTFTPQGAGDVVGPAIQKILGRQEGQAATPEEVSNLLYGKGGTPVKVGQRLIQMFGADSPEVGAIKQGLVSNIMERPPGQMAWTAEQVADRIDAATKGPGSTLTRTYLSPNEIAELQEIGGDLRNYHGKAYPTPDPTEKIFRDIIGDDNKARASNQDIRRTLFESVLRGGRESENMQNALRQRLTPQGWSTYKKGLFLHAAEPIEGIPDWGPKKTGDRLYTLLDATKNTKTFNPVERSLIKTYADVMRKITIPRIGVTNWSNTAPLLVRAMRGMGSWAGRLIGIKVAEAMFGHSLLSEAAGIAGAEAVGHTSSRVEANRVMKQLPIVADEMAKYQKALLAYNNARGPGTQKLVVNASANVIRSLRNLGIDTSTMSTPPLDQQ